jgi:hypothetical protein
MSYRSSLSQRRLDGVYFQNSTATDWPITETNLAYLANLQYVQDFIQSAYSGFMTIINPQFTGTMNGGSIALTGELIVPTISSSTNFTSIPTITTNNTVYNISTMPSGTIKMLISNVSPPAGFLPCNGALYAGTEYPSLFNAIGYTYGGSGSSFNVPNMESYFPIGGNGTTAGCSTSNYATGNGTSGATNTYATTSNFGGATTALAPVMTQAPPHIHAINDPGHQHTTSLSIVENDYIIISSGGDALENTNPGYVSGISQTNVTILSTGADIQATDPVSGLSGVNVSPPYVAVFFYIAI